MTQTVQVMNIALTSTHYRWYEVK